MITVRPGKIKRSMTFMDSGPTKSSAAPVLCAAFHHNVYTALLCLSSMCVASLLWLFRVDHLLDAKATCHGQAPARSHVDMSPPPISSSQSSSVDSCHLSATGMANLLLYFRTQIIQKRIRFLWHTAPIDIDLPPA